VTAGAAAATTRAAVTAGAVAVTAARGRRTQDVRAIAARPGWREVLMEALGLGLFMISAGVLGTLLESPASPVHRALPDPLARRALMGLCMGLTAIGLACAPWARRSGAHLNPAFTWTFHRLGRIDARTALAYTLAQFAGGLAGALLVAAALGPAFLAPPVSALATRPAGGGPLLAAAFLAELALSGGLMFLVLALGRSRLRRATPLFVGALVFLYVTVEAPLSGMSMNPARTLASALLAGEARGLWIYFIAPPTGMLLAAELHLALERARAGAVRRARVLSPPQIQGTG
jgi:aquaporin Z